jgi:hypothetical protein
VWAALRGAQLRSDGPGNELSYVNLGNFDRELLRRYRAFIEREKLRQKMLDYEKAERAKRYLHQP